MRSCQANGNFEVVPDGELALEKLSEPVADMVGEDAHHVPREVLRSSSRLYAVADSSCSVEDGGMLVLRSKTLERHAGNKELLSRRAGNQKLRMDRLLKLRTEKKKLVC